MYRNPKTVYWDTNSFSVREHKTATLRFVFKTVYEVPTQ